LIGFLLYKDRKGNDVKMMEKETVIFLFFIKPSLTNYGKKEKSKFKKKKSKSFCTKWELQYSFCLSLIGNIRVI